MKKFFCILLCLMYILICIPARAGEKFVENGLYFTVADDGRKILWEPVDKSLTTYAIPSDTQIIAGRAFYGCENLITIELPDSVISINSSAFYGCDSLVSIKLSSSLKEIGARAFESCDNLIFIDLPDSISEIGDCAFSGCKSLEKISLPTGIKTLSFGIFSGCERLTEIILPEGIIHLASMSLAECYNLRTVVIPGSVQHIDDPVIYNNMPTFVVEYGSTAHTWAKENNLPFNSENKTDMSVGETDFIEDGETKISSHTEESVEFDAENSSSNINDSGKEIIEQTNHEKYKELGMILNIILAIVTIGALYLIWKKPVDDNAFIMIFSVAPGTWLASRVGISPGIAAFALIAINIAVFVIGAKRNKTTASSLDKPVSVKRIYGTDTKEVSGLQNDNASAKIEVSENKDLIGSTYDDADSLVSKGYDFGQKGNHEQAFKLFKKAKELGNTQGAIGLGDCYRHGQGTEKNLNAAIECYEFALKKGDSWGANRLGWIYRNEGDIEKAKYYYAKSMDLNDSNGFVLYGDLLEKEENYTEALKCYQKGHDLNNEMATYRLGLLYENGNGIQKDILKAIDLYKKATDKGYKPAIIALALICNNDDFKEFDEYTKFKYIKMAYDAGFEENFCFSLAERYFYGNGVGKNIHKFFEYAEKLYLLNKKCTDTLMKTTLAYDSLKCTTMISINFDCEKLDREIADAYVSYFTKMADYGEVGYIQKMVELTVFDKVYCDYSKAWKYANQLLRQEKNEHKAEGHLYIGLMLNDGLGVEKDGKKGLMHLQKARDLGNKIADDVLNDLE